MYKVVEKKLFIDKNECSFEYDIDDVKYQSGIYVVLLNIPNEVEEVDNIYGVNEFGKIIWRIESPLVAFDIKPEEQGYNYFANSIYTGIFVLDNKFSANTFFGMSYDFDFLTGKLLSKRGLK
ncbi:hypothetical protein RU86_GL001642 [Lactococcus piscium]|uniref:Uncharacterized protein n=1 Tax=Pseudolactococcus piscium TaxID=1364 RepID=A0A2A5RUH3_9LACT|nr:hypothetical protein [Lactococcus piscium]PCS04308.1 hypothetical protein RU86_GL001642 [Lactococcus piscium]